MHLSSGNLGNIPALMLCRSLDFGGIERDISKFARHLGNHGIAPHVACFRPGGARWLEIRSSGIPVLPLPVTSFKSRSALSGAWAVRQYVREHDIRILHAFDFSADLYGIPLARMLGIPVAISSELFQRDRLTYLNSILLTAVDQMATAVFVNCEAVAHQLAGPWHVPRERIHVCYNGVETREFHPHGRRRPPELAHASIVIGAVTLFREVKNLPAQIDAFAEVLRVDSRAMLLLVGGGSLRANLEQQARDLGIIRSCIFDDATPTPAESMRAIDLFVSTSNSEGFSNALLEAMACGCCPVASRVGGTPELIRHGETGILFEPGNRRELVEALLTLIRSPATRRSMAEAAVRSVQRDFPMDLAASRLASIYRVLLNEATGSDCLS